MKRPQINVRTDDYTDEVLLRLVDATGDKKSEVVRAAILLYAKKILGLDELMKIRIAQDFGRDVEIKEID